MKYKIIQKHEQCTGCGACVAACSENWIMDNNGKAKPKKTIIDEKEYKCNKEAADSCSLDIISIKEVK